MKKISKLVYNRNNWTCVSGVAQTGIHVINSKRKNYYFGLEEWNQNNVFKGLKIAYLDSFRSKTRIGCFDKVYLCFRLKVGKYISLDI